MEVIRIPSTTTTSSSPPLNAGSSYCPCTDVSPLLHAWANCIVKDDGWRNNNNNSLSSGGSSFSSYGSMNNITTSIESFSNFKDFLPKEVLGIMVNLHGSSDDTFTCVPVTFGSNECKQHVLGVHPSCPLLPHYDDDDDDETSSEPQLPSYCYNSFCYVDPIKCKESKELFRRTNELKYLDFDSQIYYSETTCKNSNDDDGTDTSVSSLEYIPTHVTKNKFITVTIPEIWHPAHYKLATLFDAVDDDDKNNVTNVKDDPQLDSRSKQVYRNDNIPWNGWIVDYMNAVIDVSDIRGLNFTHLSGGSSVGVGNSAGPYTAAVYDVQMGVSCLSTSMFWITTERLQMTTFTVPLTTDKIYSWVKHPTSDDVDVSWLRDSTLKLAEPFDPELWGVILIVIIIVSLLGMWFTTRTDEKSKWWHQLRDKQKFRDGTIYYKTRIVAYLFVDSFLSSFNNLFSQAVNFDVESSMSRKILNFGFGLLILVVVAAYTANLAAFLTIEGNTYSNYIDSIDDAIQANQTLCGHIALKDELLTYWPDANWIFGSVYNPIIIGETTGHDPMTRDMLQNYDEGLCSVIVTGINDLLVDSEQMGAFCNRSLIRNNMPEFEMSIAFPVCDDYAKSISYWISKAEQNGVVFDNYMISERPPKVCHFSLEEENEDKSDADAVNDELRPMTLANFALPLLILAACCVIATALQIKVQVDGSRQRQMRRRQQRHQLRNDRSMANNILTNRSAVNIHPDNRMTGSNQNRQEQRLGSNGKQTSIFTDTDEQSSALNPIEAIIIKSRINGNNVNNPTSSESTLQTIREIQNYQDELQKYQNNLLEMMIQNQTSESEGSDQESSRRVRFSSERSY